MAIKNMRRILDIGDIIGIKGNLFTTQVGEKTILVTTKGFRDLLKPGDIIYTGTPLSLVVVCRP